MHCNRANGKKTDQQIARNFMIEVGVVMWRRKRFYIGAVDNWQNQWSICNGNGISYRNKLTAKYQTTEMAHAKVFLLPNLSVDFSLWTPADALISKNMKRIFRYCHIVFLYCNGLFSFVFVCFFFCASLISQNFYYLSYIPKLVRFRKSTSKSV